MSSEEVEFYFDYRVDAKLNHISVALDKDITEKISKAVVENRLNKTKGVTDVIGGVSFAEKEPIYFMFEYLNEGYILLCDFHIVEVDTYLDLINLSKAIEYESKKIRKRSRKKVKVDN